MLDYTIPNGCSIECKEQTQDIRSAYHIPTNAFLMVFVGNVGPRKNQRQVVDAYSLLSQEDKNRIYVLFVGGGEDASLKTYVEKLGLQEHLVVCGIIPKEDVHNFYHAADATVLTSISEGFGLSIIEGMAYGLPNLTFSDLPAVADLYDENAMVTIAERSDLAVARGLSALANKHWDRNFIKQYARKFSFEQMAEKYHWSYTDSEKTDSTKLKVLFVTPYITSKKHPAFLRNQTGFGYMVHDIAEYVAKLDEVDLFAAMTFTPCFELDGFRVIGNSWLKIIRNFSLKSFADGLRFIRKYKQPLVSQLRTLYVFATIGQIGKIAKNYDLIHIHGCSALTDATIRACKRKGVPCIVTLHGLNSFEDVVKLHPSLKRYERDFLVRAAKKDIPVTFISTGNKNTAKEYVNSVWGGVIDCYSVICNGCNVSVHSSEVDVRKMYNINSKDFVFVFVGNISKNKNQYQVARAWNLLPEAERSRCIVLFVGNYKEEDDIVAYIRKENLQDSLFLCGMQPKDKVHSFYQDADATILTSITEGFGLSIIEGFVYGKPNVTFADLPAIQDVFNERAMILAEERSDAALANAMQKMMKASFDRETIMNYAQKFSFERMAEKYKEIYTNTLNGWQD